MSILTEIPLAVVKAEMTSLALAVSSSLRMTFKKLSVTFDLTGAVVAAGAAAVVGDGAVACAAVVGGVVGAGADAPLLAVVGAEDGVA